MREFQRRSQNTRRGRHSPSHRPAFLRLLRRKAPLSEVEQIRRLQAGMLLRDKSKPYLVKDENCPFEPLWADDLEEYVLRDVWSLPLKEEAQKDLQSPGPSILADLRKEKNE